MAKNVNDGQSTSSPGPIPSAISESSSASVPELDADRVRGSNARSNLPLELRHLRTKDKLRRVEHPRKGVLQLRGEWLVLLVEVQQGDMDRFSHGAGVFAFSLAKRKTHCR